MSFRRIDNAMDSAKREYELAVNNLNMFLRNWRDPKNIPRLQLEDYHRKSTRLYFAFKAMVEENKRKDRVLAQLQAECKALRAQKGKEFGWDEAVEARENKHLKRARNKANQEARRQYEAAAIDEVLASIPESQENESHSSDTLLVDNVVMGTPVVPQSVPFYCVAADPFESQMSRAFGSAYSYFPEPPFFSVAAPVPCKYVYGWHV